MFGLFNNNAGLGNLNLGQYGAGQGVNLDALRPHQQDVAGRIQQALNSVSGLTGGMGGGPVMHPLSMFDAQQGGGQSPAAQQFAPSRGFQSYAAMPQQGGGLMGPNVYFQPNKFGG